MSATETVKGVVISQRKYKIFLHSLYGGLIYNFVLSLLSWGMGKEMVETVKQVPFLETRFFFILVSAIVLGNIGEWAFKKFGKTPE